MKSIPHIMNQEPVPLILTTFLLPKNGKRCYLLPQESSTCPSDYYFERENRVSVDVVPEISVQDEAAFSRQLEEELKVAMPDMNITIVIDHNYSE